MTEKINVGIVGHGFVGNATEKGLKGSANKILIDPKYGTTIQDLSKMKPSFIFVCVPTPMKDDKSFDSSIIEETSIQIAEECPDAIVIIKSTILPNILEQIYKINNKIVYNPEFLREKSAEEDFINANFLIFGGEKNYCKEASNFFLEHSYCKTSEHIFTDLKTASLVKYTINSFLASKVLFFNQIYDVYKALGTDESWEKFIDTVSRDSRIGSSHMSVPGHDQRRGFGGACFPKDTAALLQFSKLLGADLNILEKTIEENNTIRSQYLDLDEREKEQNVTF